ILGTIGRTIVEDHREWLEIVLRDYSPVFDRQNWETRERAISTIYSASCFLSERLEKVRQAGRWINESRLADAIETLFGKAEVQRNAYPIWLCPQHLDLFLPRFS